MGEGDGGTGPDKERSKWAGPRKKKKGKEKEPGQERKEQEGRTGPGPKFGPQSSTGHALLPVLFSFVFLSSLSPYFLEHYSFFSKFSNPYKMNKNIIRILIKPIKGYKM